MKTLSMVLALFALTSGAFAAPERQSGRISISGAWALYPMAVRWAEVYRKANPDVRIDVSAGGAGKGVTDTLAGTVDIGLVSRAISTAEEKKGIVPWAVAKDAVVAVANLRCPAAKALTSRGVGKSVLHGAWISGTTTNWQQFGATSPFAIHVYTRSDACGAAETWAQFFGARQEDLLGTAIYGDPNLAAAVQRDPLGIGYNNVNFVYDPKTLRPVSGLFVIPIDSNGDGSLSTNEQFYATRTELMSAISRGDYPSPPARDLYFVTRGIPATTLVRTFILWTITDGQDLLADAGYVPVSHERIAADRKRLRNDPASDKPAEAPQNEDNSR